VDVDKEINYVFRWVVLVTAPAAVEWMRGRSIEESTQVLDGACRGLEI